MGYGGFTHKNEKSDRKKKIRAKATAKSPKKKQVFFMFKFPLKLNYCVKKDIFYEFEIQKLCKTL